MKPIQTAKTIIGLITGMALALAAASAAGVGPAGSQQPVAAGQPLPALHWTDQHDRRGGIDTDTRVLLFAPDRESSQIAHEVLEPLGGEALNRSGIRYVADISGMPGLVTQVFALPRMREYSYPVLLGRDSADTAALPAQAGAVTVLRLDGGTVTGVEFAKTADELGAMLTGAPTR